MEESRMDVTRADHLAGKVKMGTTLAHTRTDAFGNSKPGTDASDRENASPNYRPFWKEPVNLLPHNLYAASRLGVSDARYLQANWIGATGVLMSSAYFENGLKIALGTCALAWALWLLDFPSGARNVLTSQELSDPMRL